ncbi:hypothetical protein [Methylobacter sp.]|uniref:hypothetical protein n=1 Tax=Methylobacter sp. TaxID=2051955 RepID=UPI0011F527FC|nr:hypothetical protein [Methylobacter sp.]TAK62052.1 MAG: hypothetical protein EPO18_11875 [Methylobacter sp.]
MATIKVLLESFTGYHIKLSLAGLTGLLSLLLLLGGCQTVSTPEQVSTEFWEAMADGDLDSARKYATRDTQYLVNKQQNLEDVTVKTETALIDGSNATVATFMTLKKSEIDDVLSFDTVLLKENNQWKVDYQQTLNNLSILPLGDIFRSLRSIGETFNKELKQQIPLFEKQIKSFSQELIRQLDEFRRQMEKAAPPEKQKPYSGTI